MTAAPSARWERKPSVNSTDGADCGSPGLRVRRSWRGLGGPSDGLDSRGPTNGRRPLPPTTGASASRTTHRVYSTDRFRNNALRENSVSPHDPQAIRTGVQHFEVAPDEAGQRLDNYVQRHLGGVPR